MKIGDLFDRSVFSNSAMKFILNMDSISSVISNFQKKSFDNWEERECIYCTSDKKCKKHSSLDRIIKTTRATRISNFISQDLDGLYISKSDIFLLNRKNNSLLIFDCPPLYSQNYPINDIWIRKINPFSIGNFDGSKLNFEIVQELEMDKILQYRLLSCYFGKIEERNSFLVIYKTYDMYQWKLEIR